MMMIVDRCYVLICVTHHRFWTYVFVTFIPNGPYSFQVAFSKFHYYFIRLINCDKSINYCTLLVINKSLFRFLLFSFLFLVKKSLFINTVFHLIREPHKLKIDFVVKSDNGINPSDHIHTARMNLCHRPERKMVYRYSICILANHAHTNRISSSIYF